MTDDPNPLWQIRARVKMLDASIAAHDKTIRANYHTGQQNTERARMAHERIDEIEDNGELLKKLLEQVETLTGRVDRMAAFCQKLKDEREAK